LSDIVARLKVPEYLIEDLVQEAWVSAVQHGDQFDRFTEEELKRRLPGLLRKMVHDKAVDLLRHLDCSPCQSLHAVGVEPIDDAEPTRVKTAERRAQLATLLARLQQEEPGDHWLLCEHRLERRKIRELAEEKGWTEHKVRCRLYRAMEKLRAWSSKFSSLDESAS
jgi:RNA polymerase sigma factor (sigma-70 family)